MAEFTLPAFAKINWFLRVTGKRDDGFHELLTAFQTVSLHDEISFAAHDEIELTTDAENLSVGEDNLIVRAAKMLAAKFAVKSGAKMHLRKNIPAPGGLGGGSSDAATALRGLVRLWKIDCEIEQLTELAATLGSDVPFFLTGGTAFGTGRGTRITPTDDVEEKFLLIVTPYIDVPTARAFAGLNAAPLTKLDEKHNLKICREELRKSLSRHFDSANDFESSVFEIEPEIGRVKQVLLECGARASHLSGSGASVFAVFENQETRQATIEAIRSENWRMFAVSTVNREQFRKAFEEVRTVVSD